LALPSTIAIDGPASSGKSSLSFALAQRLGYLSVDTGAFYRAITLLALRAHLDPADTERVTALAHSAALDMTRDMCGDGRQYTLLANGEDVTWDIHSPQVDAHVSVVAANPGVRQATLAIQRQLAARGRVIMAGRDIGTVVLPDADLKLYIDASLEKRAERRYNQRISKGEAANLAQIREGLRQRDTLDSQRETAPLLRAPDAVYLDTTALSFEQSVEAAYQIVIAWDKLQSTRAGETASQP
jgi:cytidylate kinase